MRDLPTGIVPFMMSDIEAVAADGLRQSLGGGATMALSGDEPAISRARRTVAEEDFQRWSAIGRGLTTDAAMQLALVSDAPSSVT
jgi:hypothetical protein